MPKTIVLALAAFRSLLIFMGLLYIAVLCTQALGIIFLRFFEPLRDRLLLASAIANPGCRLAGRGQAH